MDHPLIHLSHQSGPKPQGGVFAVCSANYYAIQAAMETALACDGIILIEATANQVNLSGGYSGLTPFDYVRQIHQMAENMGLTGNRCIIGMDHLGPHVWSTQPADAAFNNAVVLVRQCVRAGFRKLHLDIMPGSPRSRGDSPDMEKTARLTADLCRVAEATAREVCLEHDLLYVIGTDVPQPGGGLNPEAGVAISDPQKLAQSLSIFQSAFSSAGLESAWEKVIAVVVQPGVDFDDFTIAGYDPNRAAALAAYHQCLPQGMTYEVHAADYQQPEALKEMVQDRFNLLKIGPCLTFTLRRALYALAHIEEALPDIDHPSHLRQTMEALMIRDPLYWRSHYQGTPEELAYMRHFGLRDRIRYYWARPQAREAVTQLLHNLNRPLPRALLEQYLPDLPARKTMGTMRPEAIINFRLQQALMPYRDACWPQ